MIPVVLERDLEIAIDRHVPVLQVVARQGATVAVQGPDVRDEALEDIVVAHDSSGLRSRERGLATVSSSMSCFTTASGAPSRSSTGPHFQPSRYASISVEPSFIAYASTAAWK